MLFEECWRCLDVRLAGNVCYVGEKSRRKGDYKRVAAEKEGLGSDYTKVPRIEESWAHALYESLSVLAKRITKYELER